MPEAANWRLLRGTVIQIPAESKVQVLVEEAWSSEIFRELVAARLSSHASFKQSARCSVYASGSHESFPRDDGALLLSADSEV